MKVTRARGGSAHSGVTLIEVVIYLVLFGILIGGAVVAAFNLLEANARAQTKVILQEEGGYLLGKIEWVTSGVQFITEPGANTSGTSLVVSKWDTSIGNPISMSLVGTDLAMSTGSNSKIALNNSNVFVTGLLFTHTIRSGAGTNPESIQFSFTVNARTPNGMVVSELFPTTTAILRR